MEANPFACPICGVFLLEPYIKCAECTSPKRAFCLQCFAKGREYENHKNTHAYTIVKSNFYILDHNWTAAEEMKLLEAILEFGYGNWSDISQKMGTASEKQCEKHFLQHFVLNPKACLPNIPSPEVVKHSHPTPIRFAASDIIPRPSVGSLLSGEMAGYNPARGDFTTERDEYAELDLKNIEFTDEQDLFSTELQKTVVRIYCTHLKERAKLKHIIKKYGLLSSYRNLEYWRNFDVLGKACVERMKRFMRLMKPNSFSLFMESIINEENLKQRVKVLQECRSNGITNSYSVPLYLKLKKEHEAHKKHKTLLDEVLSQFKNNISRQQFLRRQILHETSGGLPNTIVQLKRRAPPLQIEGLPGYEDLSPKERELCAVLRLYPTNFLQHKAALIHEWAKLGSLKLATARTILKIDVNKTRKIYDLLVEEGHITK